MPEVVTKSYGAGNGVGAGTSITGLKASNGVSGAMGLISDVDYNFPFVWYLQHIQTAITGNWNRLNVVQGRAQVYFRITRGGVIDGVRVEIPSGDTPFDRSALLTVLRSNPLPKLPDGFSADSLGVRFWFMYLSS